MRRASSESLSKGSPMTVVSVDHAEPGMVLAAAVTDRQGRLLIPEGKELTDRHVNALRMWGVTHVDIEGGGDLNDGYGAVEPELLHDAETYLHGHFSRTDIEHPFVALLFEYCVTRRAHQLQKQGEPDHAA